MKYIRCCNPHDAETIALEVCIPQAIAARLVTATVRFAVDFDD